jgi:hypothetical protein
MALEVVGWVAGIVLFLAGLYVLARALFADRSRGRRRCPRCWYDMDAAPTLRCPECGKEARTAAALLRTRRHKRRAALALLLLGLGCLAGIAPRLIRDPWGTLPTPLLSVVLWFYDDPSDTIFTNMAAALYAGKTTAFERLMLARYCARKLSDPNLGGGTIPGLGVPPSGTTPRPAWSMIGFYNAQGQLLTVVTRLGKEARPAIPAVIALSRTPSPGNEQAIHTLVQLWPGTPALRERVVECLEGSERTRASTLLSISAGVARRLDLSELIEPVLRSVQRERDSTCIMGVRVLAMFGDAGTPALRELARDPREGVKSYAIAELGGRRDAAAVPDIRGALGDESWRVRETAIAALHRIREPSAVALPDLCRVALEDERVTVRMQALVSLVPIGGGDPRVVAALAEALRDPTVQIRHAAASELASLGPAALAAEAALDAATHDADESVSLAATAALEAVRAKN